MKALEIVALLEKTKGPSRFIDKEIALHMGWKRRVENDVPVWYRAENERGMPFYTRSMEAAKGMMLEISPNSAVACAWHEDFGTAVIDDGEACESVTVPIALCLAVMRIVAARQKEEI